VSRIGALCCLFNGKAPGFAGRKHASLAERAGCHLSESVHRTDRAIDLMAASLPDKRSKVAERCQSASALARLTIERW
jgi:hypothetical protein